MCDFDPVPGFYGAVIGLPHYGAVDVFFVVFALVVAFLRLGTVLTDTDE